MARADYSQRDFAPDGYIAGLQFIWNSNTGFSIGTGAAQIESTKRLLRVASAITKSGLSLSASTWYYVYLYNNAGTPDVEVSTTAPASPYSGTARSKTSDATKRFIFAFKTNASSQIYNVQHDVADGLVFYRLNGDTFRLVAAGKATTATNLDASVMCPPGTAFIFLRAASNADAGFLCFDTSDGSNSGPAFGGYIPGMTYPAEGYFKFPVNSSRVFRYWYSSAPSVGGCYADPLGFYLAR